MMATTTGQSLINDPMGGRGEYKMHLPRNTNLITKPVDVGWKGYFKCY